ncbi:MAG: hypothetical protein RQ748_08560 [Elusimicrobiales bacterium]|nr:hypothetical protein [Elusimicrobiales bacterium]
MTVFLAAVWLLWLMLRRSPEEIIREKFCDIFIDIYKARTGRRLGRAEAWRLIRLARRLEGEKAARRRAAEACREAEERAGRR